MLCVVPTSWLEVGPRLGLTSAVPQQPPCRRCSAFVLSAPCLSTDGFVHCVDGIVHAWPTDQAEPGDRDHPPDSRWNLRGERMPLRRRTGTGARTRQTFARRVAWPTEEVDRSDRGWVAVVTARYKTIPGGTGVDRTERRWIPGRTWCGSSRHAGASSQRSPFALGIDFRPPRWVEGGVVLASTDGRSLPRPAGSDTRETVHVEGVARECQPVQTPALRGSRNSSSAGHSACFSGFTAHSNRATWRLSVPRSPRHGHHGAAP